LLPGSVLKLLIFIVVLERRGYIARDLVIGDNEEEAEEVFHVGAILTC